MVFDIGEEGDGGLMATLASPDQGAYGIAVDSVMVHEDSVRLVVRTVGGAFEGALGLPSPYNFYLTTGSLRASNQHCESS